MSTTEEDPAYLFGQTERELERLQKQHAWMRTCLDGKIVFAPVDLQNPQLRVLDVGCADGILLGDLAKQVSPTAKLVGVDVMSQFLPASPPEKNVTFAVWDVTESPAPERTAAFDLTHVRYVLAGAGAQGIDKAIQNLVDTLAPGGWLQVQEMELGPDRPKQCASWNDMTHLMGAIFDKVGVGADYASGLGARFEEAGLTNVTVDKIQLPAGIKMGSKEAAENSLIPFKLTIPTLKQAVQGLGIELPSSVTDQLEERWEKDMMAEGAVFTSYVVYGQKA